MPRISDLKSAIKTAYELLSGLENQLLLSDNPKESFRLEKEIKETREIIEKYKTEIKQLQSSKTEISNKIELVGNNNIIIQKVDGSTITISNNTEDIKGFIKDYFEKQNELIKLLFDYNKNNPNQINISEQEFDMATLEQELRNKFNPLAPEGIDIFIATIINKPEAKGFGIQSFTEKNYEEKIAYILLFFANNQKFLSDKIDNY